MNRIQQPPKREPRTLYPRLPHPRGASQNQHPLRNIEIEIAKVHYPILKFSLQASPMKPSTHYIIDNNIVTLFAARSVQELTLVVKEYTVSRSMKDKYPVYKRDISRGQVNLQIPLINQLFNLKPPSTKTCSSTSP
ncbi:hypothetical protein LINGRAHAP2_LOCUS23475 [Linum grandiflorum]